jgi:hypothetical protein
MCWGSKAPLPAASPLHIPAACAGAPIVGAVGLGVGYGIGKVIEYVGPGFNPASTELIFCHCKNQHHRTPNTCSNPRSKTHCPCTALFGHVFKFHTLLYTLKYKLNVGSFYTISLLSRNANFETFVSKALTSNLDQIISLQVSNISFLEENFSFS